MCNSLRQQLKCQNHRRLTLPAAVCTLSILCLAAPAQAQLFGARSVGSPLNSPFNAGGTLNPTSSTPGPGVGMLDGSERFIRGNRSARDFVGSDRNEQSGFVGSGQAIGVGRVRTATEGLRIESSNVTMLNRPLPPQPAKGSYYPRLQVAFSVQDSKISSSEIAAEERLYKRIAGVTGDNAQLTLSGRTAILRGTVESARAAELAEQLLSFEPGIDRVQNELTLAP